MSSNSLGEHKHCCHSGPKSTYEGRGRYVTVAGRSCSEVGEGDRLVLYCTDIFGHRFAPALRLADSFADAGFRVVMPDLFKSRAMEPQPSPEAIWARLPQFVIDNPVEISCEYTVQVARALRQAHPEATLGVTGYCWGAKMTMAAVLQKATKVAVMSHPSRLTVEEAGQVPADAHLLFNCAEVDKLFTKELQGQDRQILSGNGVDATFIEYPHTQHGFAVRQMDEGDEVERARCTAETIRFFRKNVTV